MTDPTQLSPAAQAVLDATDYPEDWATRVRVAAALRAAAMHVHSDEYVICNGSSRALMIEIDDLLDLATELEGSND